MSGAAADVPERLRVHVHADDGPAHAEVLALLWHARIVLASEPGCSPGTAIVAAAGNVDAAIEACPPRCLSGERPLVIVAATFSPAGVLRAVQAGARVMLWATKATPAQLLAALQSAQCGEGRLPYHVLASLINGTAESSAPAPGIALAPLTARQRAVLALMAEGHGNAAIARVMSCSQHTIKNVSYDLMARLQVRNRAQAVAWAVRAGLI